MNSRSYVKTLLLTTGAILVLVFALTFIVDPFGFRPKPLLPIDQSALSGHSHDRLFRLAQYRNHPKSIIVLGDSRAQNLKEEYFSERGVADVSNLAYGGGSLYEAVDTFWFVNRIRRPTHVILGLPFNLWSDANDANRVKEATEILDDPLRYYLNYYVLGIAVRNLWRYAIGDMSARFQPPASRSAFWRSQLTWGIGQYYARWREPRRLREQFDRMVQYCRDHDIRLIIVIPPTHVDLQRKIEEYQLSAAYGQYLQVMSDSGTVLNFDVVNSVTSNSSNFGDPFHANAQVMREVTRELLTASGLTWGSRENSSARMLRSTSAPHAAQSDAM